MTESVPHAAPYAAVAVAAPRSPEARAVLTAYFRDIVSRYHRSAATPDEVRAAMAAEPRAGLCPPHGLFLLARQHAVSRVRLDTRATWPRPGSFTPRMAIRK